MSSTTTTSIVVNLNLCTLTDRRIFSPKAKQLSIIQQNMTHILTLMRSLQTAPTGRGCQTLECTAAGDIPREQSTVRSNEVRKKNEVMNCWMAKNQFYSSRQPSGEMYARELPEK